MSKSILRVFSSRSFVISGLTFKYLIHFEFIFETGMREESSLILQYVTVQFSQTHLLKGWFVFSLIVYSCLLCYRFIAQISVGLFLGSLFCSIDLCVCFLPVSYCFDYCSLVVQSEVRECNSFNSVFLSQDCFSYMGSFEFPY